MIYKRRSSKILAAALWFACIGPSFSQNPAGIPSVEGVPVESGPHEFSTFLQGNARDIDKWFGGLERLGIEIQVAGCRFGTSYQENSHVVRVLLRRLPDGRAAARLTRAVQGRDAYDRLIEDLARRGVSAETVCRRPEMPAASLIAVVQYPAQAAAP